MYLPHCRTLQMLEYKYKPLLIKKEKKSEFTIISFHPFIIK